MFTLIRPLKPLAPVAVVILLLQVVAGGQTARPQDLRMQEAIRLQTVERNVKEAIKKFNAIIRDFEKTDRRTTAMATLRLADCFRMLGEVRARQLYLDFLAKYPDLSDLAAQARSQLDRWPEDQQNHRREWTEPVEGSLLGDVSMNGRLLAFTDWSDRGRGDVYVQALGGKPRRLVPSERDAGNDPIASATHGAFSWDGLEFAYNWFGPKRTAAELRVISVLPGAQSRILFSQADVCCVRPYAWSRDGQWIAVVLQKRDSSADIAVISTETAKVRVRKALGWRRPSRMAFSPDGRLLAFDLQGTETNAREIYGIRLTDGGEIPLVTYRGNDALVGFAPNGAIVFTSDRMGNLGLWTAAVSGDTVSDAKLLKPDLGQFSPAGMTASGAIYYCRCDSSRGSDIKMGTFDSETGNFAGPLVDAVQEFVGSNTQPFWSPDGKSFLYRSLRGSNQDPVLAIRSADMGDPRELRPRLRDFIDPRWSPDGKSVSVIGRDFEGRQGFFKIDIDTSVVTPIALKVPGESFYALEPRMAWSRDGRGIFFRRTTDRDFNLVEWNLEDADERILLHLKDGAVRNLYLTDDDALIYMNPVIEGRPVPYMTRRDLKTGKEQELIRAPVLVGVNPSPDGRWIATTTGTGTMRTTLTLVPVAGGQPRDVWKVGADAELAEPDIVPVMNSWMPDSKSLVVGKVSSLDNSIEYWWIPIDGRTPHRIEALQGLQLPGRLRFHADGRRVVFAANEFTMSSSMPTELWVYEDLLLNSAVKR